MNDSTAITNQAQTVYFSLTVGDSVKICPFIPDPPSISDTESESVLRGFRLLDPSLGTLTEDDESSICVIYTHNKSGKQVIEYSTAGLSGRIFYAVLTGVTVHDHASVYEGGPAFATYFSESSSPQEEGQST
jgi:hypothetical protein